MGQQAINAPPYNEPVMEMVNDKLTGRMSHVWKRWYTKLIGLLKIINMYEPEFAPTAVAANTTSEQEFTITGINSGDVIVVNKPTHQTGLGIVGARASAASKVAITYMNTTGGSITPTTETYRVTAIRI